MYKYVQGKLYYIWDILLVYYFGRLNVFYKNIIRVVPQQCSALPKKKKCNV